MKEYRKATDSPEKRAKLNENKRKRTAALNTPEKKLNPMLMLEVAERP